MKSNTALLQRASDAVSTTADTIRLGGRLDASCAKQFSRAVGRLADNRTPFVIIDLSATKAVDSSGFGALISSFRRLAEVGAAAVVVCPNRGVRRLFNIAGVNRMIAIVERVSHARRLAPAARALAS